MTLISDWAKESRFLLSGIPVICVEEKDRVINCYLLVTKGTTDKLKHTRKYLEWLSAIRVILHGAQLPD